MYLSVHAGKVFFRTNRCQRKHKHHWWLLQRNPCKPSTNLHGCYTGMYTGICTVERWALTGSYRENFLIIQRKRGENFLRWSVAKYCFEFLKRRGVKRIAGQLVPRSCCSVRGKSLRLMKDGLLGDCEIGHSKNRSFDFLRFFRFSHYSVHLDAHRYHFKQNRSVSNSAASALKCSCFSPYVYNGGNGRL